MNRSAPYQKLLFRLIIPHIDDSYVWCRLREVCRLTKELCDSMLIKYKKLHDPRKSRKNHGACPYVVAEYVTKLPCGHKHGIKKCYRVLPFDVDYQEENYLWEENTYVSGKEHGIRIEYHITHTHLNLQIFAKKQYSNGVCIREMKNEKFKPTSLNDSTALS